MPVVSLSFPQELLKEADELQKTSGYASRSELVRAAIHLLSGTERKRARLSGRINGVLVIAHEKAQEGSVSNLKHKFREVIDVEVHDNVNSPTCIIVFR